NSCSATGTATGSRPPACTGPPPATSLSSTRGHGWNSGSTNPTAPSRPGPAGARRLPKETATAATASRGHHLRASRDRDWLLGDGDAVSAHTQVDRPNRWSDAGRGLAALVGGAILVVGVPFALIAWVGWPLPTEAPTLSEVGAALRDTYIPDEFLVKGLAVVCWLVWIELTASLLVEAVAYVRGRKAGAVPLAGGLQRGAARLVATVALLGSLFAAKALPDSGGLGLRALSAPATRPVWTLG